jgi:hypothetical protein
MKYFRSRVFLSALLLAVAACLLAGCNQQPTKISDVLDNPAAYQKEDVTIAGYVIKAYSLPLGITDVAAYQVGDETGKIWVITHAGAPDVGLHVGIKGKVQQLSGNDGNIFSSLLGDVIQEHQRRAI